MQPQEDIRLLGRFNKRKMLLLRKDYKKPLRNQLMLFLIVS